MALMQIKKPLKVISVKNQFERFSDVIIDQKQDLVFD